MYLSLANVEKHVRRQPKHRAMLLLGYLPVDNLECFSETRRGEAKQQLFHRSMQSLLAPLVNAGQDGMKMVCADGKIRMVYPIVAAYIADHPEQCLVACCRQNRCPQCLVQHNRRGESLDHPEVNSDHRDPVSVLMNIHAYQANKQNSVDKDGIRTSVYTPFWSGLPFCNIFKSFPPDLLHQVHKGVFKDHIVEWCSKLATPSELDERFKRMPSHTGLRHFSCGISKLSQWTGVEAKHVERVFVGVIAGAITLPAFRATRAIMDFISYAGFASHSTVTLKYMAGALEEWDKYKSEFIRLGQRSDFNIPKFHKIRHYVDGIKLLGTTDGYNTELSERLHIDFAKEGYRASNRKNYIEQMLIWLRRQEMVDTFTAYLLWSNSSYTASDTFNLEADGLEVNSEIDNTDETKKIPLTSHSQYNLTSLTTTSIHFPRNPSCRVRIFTLEHDHGAVDFLPALTRFVRQNMPHVVMKPDEDLVFDIYKRIKLSYPALQGFSSSHESDTIRASPAHPPPHIGASGTPAYFDTAIVAEGEGAELLGMEGLVLAFHHQHCYLLGAKVQLWSKFVLSSRCPKHLANIHAHWLTSNISRFAGWFLMCMACIQSDA